MERRGVPTVTFVSDAFHAFAKVRAKGLGMPDLRLVVVPHPLADRPKDEVAQLALARIDEVIAALVGEG